MRQRFFRQNRVGAIDGQYVTDWLRDALAALPEPWAVLVSCRRSSADGPPWVRYIVLNPTKGIALVDVDPTELAVAPLEDFFEHTGLAALRSGGLPIVAVTLPIDGKTVVAEVIEAAFVGLVCQLGNPNWCEAVIELLLATPELCLTRLRRTQPRDPKLSTPSAACAFSQAAATATPVAPTLYAEQPESQGELAAPMPRESLTMREPWPLGRQGLPPRRTWRSWPTSPVTAIVVLLAVAVILLVSRPVSRPSHETASNFARHLVGATASPAAKPPSPPTVAVALPAPAADHAQKAITPIAQPVTTPLVPPPPPRKVIARSFANSVSNRYVGQPTRHTPPVSREQRTAMASASAVPATACADVLHPDRPGGWNYRGPPVAGCLPIRFFGLIGMR